MLSENIFEDVESLIVDECKLRGYSGKTVKSYLFHVKRFLASKKSPREYLLMLIGKNASDETVRSACFAIKFYLKAIKNNSSEIQSILDNLPIVKRENKLPVILSKEEIERIVFATKNLNHQIGRAHV